MNKSELITQLEVTVSSLEKKATDSPEPIVVEYLDMYRAALGLFDNLDNDLDMERMLQKLLSCARGYLETSSNYKQEFLNEMSKSEKLIRLYLQL